MESQSSGSISVLQDPVDVRLQKFQAFVAGRSKSDLAYPLQLQIPPVSPLSLRAPSVHFPTSSRSVRFETLVAPSDAHKPLFEAPCFCHEIGARAGEGIHVPFEPSPALERELRREP